LACPLSRLFGRSNTAPRLTALADDNITILRPTLCTLGANIWDRSTEGVSLKPIKLSLNRNHLRTSLKPGNGGNREIFVLADERRRDICLSTSLFSRSRSERRVGLGLWAGHCDSVSHRARALLIWSLTSTSGNEAPCSICEAISVMRSGSCS